VFNNPDGGADDLEYECGALYGGDDNDKTFDINIVNGTQVFICGETNSDDLPLGGIAAGIGQQTIGGGTDGFMATVDQSDCSIDCATFVGGSATDRCLDLDAMAVSAAADGATTIILGGETQSTNLPTTPQCGSVAGPIQAAKASGFDAMIACYLPNCCRLFQTYHGFNGNDHFEGISARMTALGDEVLFAGYTTSTNLPVMGGGFQDAVIGGDVDGFAVRIDFSVDVKLPIELASYNVTSKDAKVYLSWRSASEVNNAGFEIQRAVKTEKPVFQSIASFLVNKELVGAGTSATGRSYSFVDNSPTLKVGTEYIYRLIDVATDGQRSEHPTKTVRVEGATDVDVPMVGFAVSGVKPNPAAGDQIGFSINLPEAGAVSLEIYGSEGKRVSVPFKGRQMAAGTTPVTVDISDLDPGVYTARIISAKQTKAVQFVVVR
jgi:hypothetical protein